MEADEPPVAGCPHDHHGTDRRVEGGYRLDEKHHHHHAFPPGGQGGRRHEEGQRAKRYFPAVDREDAIEAETETFLDKVGGLGLLMNAMVEKNALTENDIAELSAILEKAGGKT